MICFSFKDFVRNQKGLCIRKEDCPHNKAEGMCSENEVFSECGSDCGQMCRDLVNGTVVPKECSSCEKGCFYEKGFSGQTMARVLPKKDVRFMSSKGREIA